MAKTKSHFICSHCGYTSPQWLGKCSQCESWNTLTEEIVSFSSTPFFIGQAAQIVSFSDISSATEPRIDTGWAEVDRVLGGGLVPGSVILLGGDPGIGKSTLALQLTHRLAQNNRPVLYVSGEESQAQIKLRADRLFSTIPHMWMLCETRIEAIESRISELTPAFVIIDSIQTMSMSDFAASPGSVTQVRESALRLMSIAKRCSLPILLIGHVTKDGMIAGPKLLEHMVDTVLYFEGDKRSHLRILRTIKNRFGATHEVGLFDMTSDGLHELLNPSQVLLDSHLKQPGNALTCIQEGSRSLIIELQSLVIDNHMGIPRRTCNGLDANRLSIILAALQKHTSIMFSNQDVYLNVIGGLKISDPCADLAIAMAAVSSFRNRSLPTNMIVLGEVGLGGEIRPLHQVDLKLKEAASIGLTQAVIPARSHVQYTGDMTLHKVTTLVDAIALID